MPAQRMQPWQPTSGKPPHTMSPMRYSPVRLCWCLDVACSVQLLLWTAQLDRLHLARTDLGLFCEASYCG